MDKSSEASRRQWMVRINLNNFVSLGQALKWKWYLLGDLPARYSVPMCVDNKEKNNHGQTNSCH